MMPASSLPDDLGLFRVLRDDGTADPKHDPLLPEETVVGMYREMQRLRLLDTRMVTLQRQGRVGFYGACTGQEATPIATGFALDAGDWVFPALRESSIMLVRGFPLSTYLAQVFGNSRDVLKGRQMPSHMSGRAVHQVSWSSCIGPQVPQAVGAAWAAKLRKEPTVTVGFLGDGATSQPDFHNAMNFAAVFKIPTVIVCQNNHWSISVPTERQTASQTLAQKARAYGMPGVRIDGNDVLAVYVTLRDAAARARAGGGPTFVEALTYRIGAHSTSDDPTRYRSQDEVDSWVKKDPIDRFRKHLLVNGLVDDARLAQIDETIHAEISAAIADVESAGPPDRASLFDDVYAELPWHLREQRDALLKLAPVPSPHGSLSYLRSSRTHVTTQGMFMSKTYDAIVIGGGPGGYPAAIRLGQLKQKVVCIEMDEVGGVCLNWGCIPSKALISASHTYEAAKGSASIGIKAANVEVDANVLQDWKGGIVKKLTGGVRGLLRANGAELIAGRGVITGPNTVEVTLKDGTKETLEAKTIVLATGSSTIEIPTFKFDGKQIIGAKEAVSLREIPKRLLVIGGGIIGLELGTVYQKFGSELTVVEALPQLLTGVDPDAAAVVEKRLVKHGAKIFKNAKALGYEKQADGSIAVKIDVAGKAETIVTDVVLVAVGMRPNSKGVGLESVGVKIDERGFVPSDKFCRTNVPSIYSIGDVSGGPLLAHKATKEGEIAAEVIAGHKAAKDWVSIPGAIFTDPEIGTVGLTEAQAKEAGHELVIGKMPFAASGRAMAVRETDGFVKVVADKKTHQILGWHIVGPSATDMISEGALSLEMAAVLEDVALTVHPHPTLGEAVMVAAQHALGHAIDILNK